MKQNYSSLRILLIEDHLGDYKLVEEYLREGHNQIELTRALSFIQASQFLQSHSYDAVMLDLSLPDSGDAISLVKEIVKLAKSTPVIVLTGNSNKLFGIRTLSLGISDYEYDQVAAGRHRGRRAVPEHAEGPARRRLHLPRHRHRPLRRRPGARRGAGDVDDLQLRRPR